MKFSRQTFLIFLYLNYAFGCNLYGQCIAVYPYHETFESSVGGWVTGGTNNSWAWGQPAKPIINTAGQGIKCWVTGGLTGAAYNNAERSWIQSPCFDFTSLLYPYIQFKIFWQSERKFDGSNLQYSINNGVTWINVGTTATITDCYNDNWYNYNSINYLTSLATVKEGWSGNNQPTIGGCQGGSGSNNWVIAKHCLTNLAGQSNVIFRFTFGAGTTCNVFDGVGIDDIYIQNAPRNIANFNSNCTSTSNFSFTDSSTNCPAIWNWNFDDIASGVSNTSTIQNPTHHFSNAGVYNVRLIATNLCSGIDTIVKTIYVLKAITDSSNVSCPNGKNGMAKVQVIGSNSSISYSWNTIPIQHSDSILNLSTGVYVVNISQPNTCATTATIHIKEPKKISHSYSTISSICGSANGSASVTIAGGTPAYTYAWQPVVSTTSTATNLLSGNYMVTITDMNSCIDTMHLFVPNGGGNMVLAIINKKDVTCFGEKDGTATIQISGGTPGFKYVWSPNVSTASTANSLAANTYFITVTDTNNCSSQIQTTINQPLPLSASHQVKNTTCGKNNGEAILVINGGIAPYTYLWASGSSLNTIKNLLAGTHSVTITDANFCKIADTISIQPSIPLQIALTSNPDSCEKSTGRIFTQIISGTSPFVFLWKSNSSTNSFIEHLSANKAHIVFVTDSNLCKDTAQATVAALGKFNIYLGADTEICSSQNHIVLTLPNYTSFLWQDGSTQHTLNIKAAGQYSVLVENQYGCYAVDTINFTEHCVDVLQAPNAFSPNNDGIDDEFGPITNSPEALKFYTIKIFNRWGEQVFISDEYDYRWNGKFNNVEQEIGAYIYLIEYNFEIKTPNIKLKGDLILVK